MAISKQLLPPSPVTLREVGKLHAEVTLDLRTGIYLLTHRKQFADLFMRAYAAYRRIAKDPDVALDPSFIGFLRTIDVTIPQQPSEYRKHPVYHVAKHLQRLAKG